MHTDKVIIGSTEILSDDWYTLRKITYDYLQKDGTWETQSREAYDRGNGATILLYNTESRTVILTRQFRLPTFINGNPTGMFIESCAGLLETRIIRKRASKEKPRRKQVIIFLPLQRYLKPICRPVLLLRCCISSLLNILMI